MSKDTQFKVGDVVARRQVQAFKYSRYQEGVIVEKTYDGRNKIRWTHKSGNGQQHSTIQSKYLTLISTT